jgi:hypothetical protein
MPYDPNVALAQQMNNLQVQKHGATREALTGGIELSGAG